QSHERVMSKKQRSPGADPDVELDTKVSVAVAVVVALRAPRPTLAISNCLLGLSNPSRIIERRWDRVRRRGDGEDVGDHHLVKPDQGVVNLPRPLWRPVPI